MTARLISSDSAKQALLERLLDDAAVFPPAQLPMRQALRAHARHRESAYRWVGGRFVLAASHIDEFVAERERERAAIELSIILDAGSDVRRVAALRAPDALGSSLETVVDLSVDGDPIEARIAEIGEAWAGEEVPLWCEAPYRGGWRTPPDTTLASLAGLRAVAPANVTLGAKVRCGGVSAEAVPSVDDLAAFVVVAQRHGVPWKATAGLHHPVRGRHEGQTMHGFLNLFVAGVLLHAGALEPQRVAAVIAEEDPRAFVVDPAHVAWRDARAGAEAVAAARTHCTAFGSCSFEEPVNGLRELGILS